MSYLMFSRHIHGLNVGPALDRDVRSACLQDMGPGLSAGVLHEVCVGRRAVGCQRRRSFQASDVLVLFWNAQKPLHVSLRRL